ncbi:tyrosine-type recombinase/integrase [Pseudactinotalea terrae]|uniref:tyrosine-type recombinase/integrase n=1 Tax=Pseudactinotalea terrae TaxID=1743262 RepID=UPI0019D504E5|nr:site-specific integrase [Pseudactinotalea terrae]
MERLRSGRWRARYVGADGRLRSAPVTFDTRGEADRWLVGIRADLLRGQWAPPERAEVTLAEYLTAWQRQRAPQLRPRTRDLYARLIARWLAQPVGTGRDAVHLAPLALSAISPPLVREWFAAVTTTAHQRAAARLLNGSGASRRTGDPARAWARAQGLEVAATGRLPRSVHAAWSAAGRPDVRPAPEVPADAGRTTAAQAYRLLHTVLTQAVSDGLLSSNPARIAGAGHVAHPERLPLTPAEVNALAGAVPDRYAAAVLLAAWSGLRPGEVFALRRRDLDTSTATVTVRRTLVEIAGQPISYGPPKSAAGRRTVALPAFVAAALAEHLLAHTTDTSPEALIFTTTTGAPVSAPARSSVLRRARALIGRPDATWHHLRHTGATLAAISGATQAELQRRIGHSTARAAAIYQHATTERDRTIATALHELGTARTATNVRALRRA